MVFTSYHHMFSSTYGMRKFDSKGMSLYKPCKGMTLYKPGRKARFPQTYT